MLSNFLKAGNELHNTFFYKDKNKGSFVRFRGNGVTFAANGIKVEGAGSRYFL